VGFLRSAADVWSIRDIGPSVGQPYEDVAVKPILISVTVLLISTGLVKGGRYAGEKIGAFEGGGGSYSGKITDPYAKKTYSGTIRVSADTVTLKGCVMKVVCESQKWSLQ
jgi:uncharacterized protein (DUF2147 family)